MEKTRMWEGKLKFMISYQVAEKINIWLFQLLFFPPLYPAKKSSLKNPIWHCKKTEPPHQQLRLLRPPQQHHSEYLPTQPKHR